MVRYRFIALVALALCACACSRRDEPKAAEPSPATPGSPTAAQAGTEAAPTPTPSPGNSTPAPAANPAASGCLVDQGGCRTPAAPVAACSAEAAPVRVMSLDELMAAPQRHADQAIALRGPLVKSGAGCTEVECDETCCNTCTSIITVGDPAQGAHVRLDSTSMPGQYLCRGDESLVCCAVEARGQEVLAQGTLQIAAGEDAPIYQLWVSELCASP